ncbi:aspartate/glutamate racemase family protein [Alsobacter sp. R-9]
MLLHVVNPNTTAAMTARIAAAAQAAASPGTTVRATTPQAGPVSIEGFYDEAFSVPFMLGEIAAAEAAGATAHVIACFDDTGLEAARCIARGPVIGIGEAAYHVASLLAHRFSVVTTLSRSIPALENNLLRYGLDRRCARVRASEVPVLELDDPASDAVSRISAEIERAKSEDGAEAIVLGCAGMADLAASLSRTHGIPVVDGVAAAVRLAEAVVGLGLTTSKSGGYASPRAKPYTGVFAPFAPR